MPATGLQAMLDALRDSGFDIFGPMLRDGAVTIDKMDSVDTLPRGVSDNQGPGRYRATQTDDPRYFAHNLGAESWKQLLFPSRRLLLELDADLIAPAQLAATPAKRALLGVRSCDLAAIQIQQRVFAGTDGHYDQQLAEAFVLGVHCATAAATCFCASMQTGPEFVAAALLDLLLTEIHSQDGHYFLVQPVSERGRQLVSALGLDPADANANTEIKAQLTGTRQQINKRMPANARALLADNPESRQWDAVAERCLSCANCTLVCPTCFCANVEEDNDLKTGRTQRWLVWDSCFDQEHSHTHAGSVRHSTRSRYRQWLTHKLSNWHEQFGSSGCVGCGRCVTWCPVGIDLVAEITALSELTE